MCRRILGLLISDSKNQHPSVRCEAETPTPTSGKEGRGIANCVNHPSLTLVANAILSRHERLCARPWSRAGRGADHDISHTRFLGCAILPYYSYAAQAITITVKSHPERDFCNSRTKSPVPLPLSCACSRSPSNEVTLLSLRAVTSHEAGRHIVWIRNRGALRMWFVDSDQSGIALCGQDTRPEEFLGDESRWCSRYYAKT